MKRIWIALAAVVAMLSGVYWFLSGRDDAPQAKAPERKLQIVTTNSILEDMVHNVGQDRIELYSIVQRGVDPHEYEPKPTDIAQATEADLIFHNGLNLETGGSGWFTKLVVTAHKRFDEDVFAASDGVKAQYLTTNVKEQDPHAWLDLSNGMQYVRTITAKMKAADPTNADYYQQNADRYLAKLSALHQTAQSQFLDLPESQRLLVTSEGAFKYFAASYHVTPAYIWEINTESQGTPEQMATVLAKIRSSDVRSLFVETSVSPKAMNKVAQETGLKVFSKVFTDSLAKQGQPGDTYYTMMKWNLDHIHAGLSATK